MPHAHIIGTGSSTPERILSNKDLEGIVETTDEWIIRRSGIKERHISSNEKDESATDLATQASVKALAMAGVSPEELDMIVVGTVTPEQQFPSTACMVQKELKASKAAAFDISAGCSGFLYALSTVDNAVQTGNCRKALVIGVERLSGIVNWQDRGTCVLLADGAGAVVIDSVENDKGILSTHIRSDGTYWDLLYSTDGNSILPEVLEDIDLKPYHLKMEGNRLFKRAVEYMASISEEALEKNGLSSDDIKLVVPHQANIRIIQALSKSLKIPMDRVYTNIHKYGNTSSATIPLALDEAYREGVLKKGDNVLLVSFGAGLTWASTLLRWAIDPLSSAQAAKQQQEKIKAVA